MFAICMLLVIIMVNDWKKPSDVYSKLPPPEPKPTEPTYFEVYAMGKPSWYYRADTVRKIQPDLKGDIVIVTDDGIEVVKAAEGYRMISADKVSDLMWTDELKKEIYMECYEPQH